MPNLKVGKLVGEILHFNSVRMRVTGSGSLIMSLNSLDDIISFSMANLTLSVTTNREPLNLANLSEQRAYLKLSTININEYFVISKIVIFVAPVESGYPQ